MGMALDTFNQEAVTGFFYAFFYRLHELFPRHAGFNRFQELDNDSAGLPR